MGVVADGIRRKLEAALQPTVLDIRDDSARHAGHAGAREGGESHFHVMAISPRFSGLNRVERQRLVYGALATELAGPVHALSLALKAPGEA